MARLDKFTALRVKFITLYAEDVRTSGAYKPEVEAAPEESAWDLIHFLTFEELKEFHRGLIEERMRVKRSRLSFA